MKEKIGLFILSFLFLFCFGYLIVPSPDFPAPPNQAVQSMEEADTEIITKRAYFTNYSREEVIRHYQEQFKKSRLFGIPLITFRLNYPPEDAQTLIRDQTRSTYLEELTHPLRESFFINGFEPKQAKDDIWYRGEHFSQKITVKYVYGSLGMRLAVLVLVSILIYLLFFEWRRFFSELVENVKRN